jgi:raffinose/stachyose/melibiose transport system permease protein
MSPSAQGYLLLLPAVAIYLLFALYPMLDVLLLSFQEWNGLTEDSRWVGLDNFRAIMTQDPVFWGAFRNTLIWTAFAVVIPNLIGFGLALALNQNIPGRAPLRVAFYLPVIIAPIAVATIWKWMYDPFFGLWSGLLTEWGLQGWIQDWLGDRRIALWSVFVAYVWQTVGFSMVLFLAGLRASRRRWSRRRGSTAPGAGGCSGTSRFPRSGRPSPSCWCSRSLTRSGPSTSSTA